MLAREHGKTIPDAKGDIQRGIEVIEVCLGAPHMLKANLPMGPGRASIFIPCASRWARCRHHAVQFPGDDPDVEIRTGDCLRQRLNLETVRARSRRADAAGRTDD